MNTMVEDPPESGLFHVQPNGRSSIFFFPLESFPVLSSSPSVPTYSSTVPYLAFISCLLRFVLDVLESS